MAELEEDVELAASTTLIQRSHGINGCPESAGISHSHNFVQLESPLCVLSLCDCIRRQADDHNRNVDILSVDAQRCLFVNADFGVAKRIGCECCPLAVDVDIIHDIQAIKVEVNLGS